MSPTKVNLGIHPTGKTTAYRYAASYGDAEFEVIVVLVPCPSGSAATVGWGYDAIYATVAASHPTGPIVTYSSADLTLVESSSCPTQAVLVANAAMEKYLGEQAPAVTRKPSHAASRRTPS